MHLGPPPTRVIDTTRKFDERRSLSRIGWWVLVLAVWMVTSTRIDSRWWGSISAVEVTSAKCPRTVIMPRCLAANSTFVR